MRRCKWCEDGGVVQKYHDEAWGIPVHDDRLHFEYLMMEVMQCGLNWTMMLKKREIFRLAFDSFDYERVAGYGPEQVERILNIPGMIRSPRKVAAVIGDAAAFIEVRRQFGSFDRFLWDHTGGKTLVYGSRQGQSVASDELSCQIAGELKKLGFSFLGPVTVYAHLQACGLVNDHEPDCFMYQRICGGYPVKYV